MSNPVPVPPLVKDTSTRTIRSICRKKRQALTYREQRLHSLELTQRLWNICRLRRWRRFAVYLALDGEIDLSPLFVRLRKIAKVLYLPVLRPRPQRKLWFARYQHDTTLLQANRFGILEPALTALDRRPPQRLDVVLVPVVAFDIACNRLGRGGGFYDRTFSYRNYQRTWQRPRLIGIAHECQQVAALPVHNWDVAMDAIITERNYITHTGGTGSS